MAIQRKGASQFGRDDVRMQTDSPGRPGFQYPLFVPAGELRYGNMASFLEADLNHDEYAGATASRTDTQGFERAPMNTQDKVYAGIPTGKSAYWREHSESVEEGWDRKLDEAHEHGLVWDIEDEGRVKKPVLIQDSPEADIKNGHHRIAAAADLDPSMEVPVIYGRFMPGSEYDHSKDRG